MESMCNIGNSYLLSKFQLILFIELHLSILLSYYLIHIYINLYYYTQLTLMAYNKLTSNCIQLII